ncbi:MAG TPA: sigma-70 family RNA polymerase sigma factor [Mycobacteriales bacterium]|jgi:RNA polymerase sigma factor, sigma-70 family
MTDMAFGTAALLKRAGSGDQDAWDELVSRHSGLLWAVARAYRLGQADAADAVQTTWLRLLEHLDRIHEPDRLGGWLVTTLRRECLSILRRARRERLNAGDDAALDVPDGSDPLDSHLLLLERDAALWQAFGCMPERCQRLLRALVASPPLSYDEVSTALGMPIGSIGPTRARCLHRLRILLERTGSPPEPRESSEERS